MAFNVALNVSLLASETLVWQRGPIIGSGRFGQVSLALRVPSAELIALKQIYIEEESDKGTDHSIAAIHRAQSLSKLDREARIVEKLHHPNVIQFFGTEKRGPFYYFFMEYIPTGSILRILKEFGPFKQSTIRTYIQQVLRGLEYLHDLRVAHRDLKCANLLLSEDGIVKIADFGTATTLSNDDPLPTPTDINGAPVPDTARSVREGIGSPYWMAPEIVRAEKSADGWIKADIWGVGCLVIEMATANPPWHDLSNPLTVMYHIASETETPEIPDQLSPCCREFVMMCLAKDPCKRATASELLTTAFIVNEPENDEQVPELSDEPQRQQQKHEEEQQLVEEDGRDAKQESVHEEHERHVELEACALTWSSSSDEEDGESDDEAKATETGNNQDGEAEEESQDLEQNRTDREAHDVDGDDDSEGYKQEEEMTPRDQPVHPTSVERGLVETEAKRDQVDEVEEPYSSSEDEADDIVSASLVSEGDESTSLSVTTSCGAPFANGQLQVVSGVPPSASVFFGTVRALADYTSNENNELSLIEGQAVHVLDIHSSGWWKGQCQNGADDIIGWFPCTYVEWLETNHAVDFLASVKMSFSAMDPTELSLMKEEVIRVTQWQSRADGFWFQGTNSQGLTGWFPFECIERLPTESNSAQPTTTQE